MSIVRWYSCDPRNGNIILYGYKNNKILEEEYQSWDKVSPKRCIRLPKGEIPKEAEVMFMYADGGGEQSTPAYRIGRFGDTRTGTRSIKRYVGPPGPTPVYTFKTRFSYELTSMHGSRSQLVDMQEAIKPPEEDDDKVVRWKWAGMTQHNHNLHHTSSFDVFNADLDWKYYPEELSDQIEQAFQEDKKKIDVEIGMVCAEVIFMNFDRELAKQERTLDGRTYIRFVKRFKVLPDECPMEVDDEDVCSLCLNNLNRVGTKIITLGCGHQIHAPCGFDLVQMNPDALLCPLCRAPFNADELKMKHFRGVRVS